MAKIYLFFILMGALTSFAQPGSAWKLIFEDNFDGTELDQTKWNYNYSWGKTHNHRAYMDEDQVAVLDGKLKITAIEQRHPDAPDGTDKYWDQFGYLPFDYTSGAVNTNSKFNITYGYIEGRFKMSGHGTWPAFWALNQTGEWPPEIDILECPHDRTNHHFYYHYGPDWQNEASFGGQHNGPDKSLDFHTYGVEWGPDYMHFYFDGVRVSTNSGRDCKQGKNMYLIINLAVGGWSGDPAPEDVFPTSFECDWVRAWQRDRNTGNWDLEDGVLGQWGKWNDAAVTTACAMQGNFGLQLSGSPASSERLVDVQPNTNYVFGGWGKKQTTENYTTIGVKDYGGTEQQAAFSSTDWGQQEIAFTTGANATTARIYFFQSDGTGSSCADSLYLKEVKPDCNGVMGGTAYTDKCGECVGGTTTIQACEPIKEQAEDISCVFDGTIDNDYTGYDGTGYINGPKAAGTSVSFTVHAETATNAVLSVQYANGGASDRPCQVLVNGTVAERNFSMPPTTDWIYYKPADVTLPLQSGDNKITLTALSSDGLANLDFYFLYGNATFMRCEQSVTQTIPLNEGWNLISLNVAPEDSSIGSIFSGIDVQKILTQTSFWASKQPAYLNSLSALTPGEGYFVFQNSADTVQVTGIPISNVIEPFSIDSRWQLIGVPYQQAIPVDSVFNQTNCHTIMNFDGFWQPNGALNSIDSLIPGKAYLLER